MQQSPSSRKGALRVACVCGRAEVQQYTQATASMHTKLSSLEAENKKLQPALDKLKQQMADMSIELG